MLIIAIVIIGVVASRPFLFPGPSNSNNPSQTPNNNNNNNNSNNNNNGGSSPQTATYQIYTALPYSVLVPKGWHGYGGQTPTGYVVPGIYFYAKDSTGAQSIFFAQSDIPYFIDPSSTDPISGYTVGYLCPQGHWYSPLAQAYSGTGCTSTPSSSPYIVYQALTATEYAQQIQSQPCRYIVSILCAAATQNNPAFSLAVDSVADSPGLLNKMSNWFELTCGPHNNGQSPLTSAASARLSYSVNGVSYQSGVLIEICGFQIGTYKYWYASVSGFTAPASDAAKVVSIYRTIMPTVVLNFDWAKSVINNAGTQESIINGYINQWQQADIQMFQIQNGGNNAAEGWIDALDGVQTGTANGQYYKVPSEYSHAWLDSSGQFLYVSTGSTAPDLSGLTPVNLP